MAQRKLERDTQFYCKDKDGPLLGLPVVYLPCGHDYYHAALIPRSLLGHQQYTDFLATPKGFRWNKQTGLIEKQKPKICRRRKCNNEEILMETDQRYINDLLTDVWNVLTPDSIKQLQTILMEEFDMTDKQAQRFLEEQRLRSIFCQERATTRMNLGKRHRWVKRLAGTLSGKFADYLHLMLKAKRTRRVRAIGEVLIRRLGELTGEECTLQEAGNPFQSVEVFLADRLAVWLANVVLAREIDPELCREEAFCEVGGCQEEAQEEE